MREHTALRLLKDLNMAIDDVEGYIHDKDFLIILRNYVDVI